MYGHLWKKQQNKKISPQTPANSIPEFLSCSCQVCCSFYLKVLSAMVQVNIKWEDDMKPRGWRACASEHLLCMQQVQGYIYRQGCESLCLKPWTAIAQRYRGINNNTEVDEPRVHSLEGNFVFMTLRSLGSDPTTHNLFLCMSSGLPCLSLCKCASFLVSHLGDPWELFA